MTRRSLVAVVGLTALSIAAARAALGVATPVNETLHMLVRLAEERR